MALSLAVPMSAGMATFTPLAAQDESPRQGPAQAETAAGPIGGSKPDKGSAGVGDPRSGSRQLVIQPHALTLALGDKQALSAWVCAVGDSHPRGPDGEPGTDDDTCSPAKATTWSVRDAGAASFAPDHGKKVRLSADAVIAQTLITAELGELSATATLAIDDVAAQQPAKPAKKAAESKGQAKRVEKKPVQPKIESKRQGKKAEGQSRKKGPAKSTAAPSKSAPPAPAKRSTKKPPPAVEQAETRRAEKANDQGANTKEPPRQATKETPSPAVATEPFIVTFESGTGKARQRGIVERAGGTPGRALGRADMRKVTLPASNRAKAVAALRNDPSVRSVDPDYRRTVNANPSDYDFGQQWNLSGDRAGIRWDEVWVLQPPLVDTVTLAILDTGVDPSHPDLDGVVDVASSDPNGHGTWMAGIAAAETDNDEGIAGVAYDGVRIRPITVIGADGSGHDSEIIAGIQRAIDTGADVMLMAFSGRNRSSALQDAVDAALDAGIVVVASVGNEASTAASYPAGYPGVIGVAASRKDPLIAAFSDRGPSTYMAAPGVDIPTLAVGGKTINIRGTSAAAAEVAGAAALLLATGAAPSDIARRLSTTAQPTDVDGIGILDLAQALSDGQCGRSQALGRHQWPRWLPVLRGRADPVTDTHSHTNADPDTDAMADAGGPPGSRCQPLE